MQRGDEDNLRRAAWIESRLRRRSRSETSVERRYGVVDRGENGRMKAENLSNKAIGWLQEGRWGIKTPISQLQSMAD